MTKETKNITARYGEDNGNWEIKDNGVVIACGKGIIDYVNKIAEIRETATKKVVLTKTRWVRID